MSEVRPIDANALKKHKFTTQIANGVEIEDIDVVPVSAIDNTPTVKFSLMPADETKEDAYKRGYEKGKAEGILKGCNTRSKGEWIPVSERLPEETFNPNTQDFGEILCSTIWNDVRVYKFGQPIGREKAHFWDYGDIVDEFVIAWQPLPKPYKKEGEEE